MRAHIQSLLAALVVGLVFAPGGNATAGMIKYQEFFDNSSGSTQAPSTAGWAVHVGTNAKYSNTDAFSRIRNEQGDPINFGTVPEGFLASNFPGSTTLFWTDEVKSQSLSTADVESVSWFQGNAKKTDQYRLALRVFDGVNYTWYASSEAPPQGNPVGSFGTFSGSGNQVSVDPSKLTWNFLNFNGTINASGTVLTLGAKAGSGALPSGTIDAIGLFINDETGFLAIDTFTVTAVPEPSTLVLTGVGLSGVMGWAGLCWRRKARRLEPKPLGNI